MPAYWNESVREELQSIPREAFQNKLTLQKVIFSEALEMIDEGAFSGCNNLTEFDFSKATQLRSIEYRAFYECSGLRDLDLSAKAQPLKALSPISFKAVNCEKSKSDN